MQQIADWLKTLGMSEYAQRFAENGIEIDVLSELTDQDLEKLGVLLGHRRKYHGMRRTAYHGVCGVQEYAEFWPACSKSQPAGTDLHRIITGLRHHPAEEQKSLWSTVQVSRRSKRCSMHRISLLVALYTWLRDDALVRCPRTADWS
jgi:SAM domain (Sterile alpha motif)